MTLYDLVIIGGGINGCGCAADAAMRGLSVLLCEQDDIASKTSSSSSKLIHGGLRYLEHYDMALVKKALDEQQILMNLAPHLVHPLPFVLPHDEKGRPMWLLRTGLFLYDHLSHTNTLPDSKCINRHENPTYFQPLIENLDHGFVFYDCKTDDARLTLINALQAKEHGAKIMPQTALIAAEIQNNNWQLTLQSKSDKPFQVQAKALINAAGPWIQEISQILHTPLSHSMTLVKGSHLVVHKLYEGEHAYLLQHTDKRVVFVIPYHGYSLIGTTDVAFNDSLDHIAIEPKEVDYLIDLVQHSFHKTLHKSEIITTWSGVRPLLSSPDKNAAELSRDYVIEYNLQPAPIVTIYGGKITTYRQLAKQAIDQLKTIFPTMHPVCSETTPLPGAAYRHMDFKAYQHYAREKYHWLDADILEHYLQNYGARTEMLLANCQCMDDLGAAFTPLLYSIEIIYLVREEWANSAEDILWRRTKFGLSIDRESHQALILFIDRLIMTKADPL